MKCAVAIVLALIGMTIANPVPHIGLTSLVAPYHVLPAVSYSSVINHGVTVPRVHVPVVKSVILPVSLGHGLGWNKYWH